MLRTHRFFRYAPLLLPPYHSLQKGFTTANAIDNTNNVNAKSSQPFAVAIHAAPAIAVIKEMIMQITPMIPNTVASIFIAVPPFIYG